MSRFDPLFCQQVNLAPQQIIRYHYGGIPLLYLTHIESNQGSDLDEYELMSPTSKYCQSCGAVRVFEFQLMPALLALPMELKDNNNNNPQDKSIDFDFGTMTIWCCSNSCSNSSYEIGIVQRPV